MLLQHGISAVSKLKMEKTLRVLKSALERRQFVSWLKMDARQVRKPGDIRLGVVAESKYIVLMHTHG